MTQTIIIDTTSPITAADRKIIQRATRLLVMIVEPSLFARAKKEGYTTAEHRLAWKLASIAGGSTLTFEDVQAEVLIAQGDTAAQEKRMALLQQIDEFENTWIPRARAILRRVVSPARRANFEAVFFEGIEQQPLGPGVIGSVEAFLGRVTALESSSDPDARPLRKTLAARGLTDERIAEVTKLIDRAKTAGAGPSVAEEAISGANANRTERIKAMQDLRDWYFDWSTTLRSAFNGREQIKLGLTAAPSSRKSKKSKKGKKAGEVSSDAVD